MNPTSSFSVFDPDNEHQRYLQDDGTLFWSWLKTQVGARYSEFRQQPLNFVRQIFSTEWQTYIRDQVLKAQRQYYNELLNQVTVEAKEPRPLDLVMNYIYEKGNA